MKIKKSDLQKIIKAEVAKQRKILAQEVDYRFVIDNIESNLVENSMLEEALLEMKPRRKAVAFQTRLNALIKDFAIAFANLEVEAQGEAGII